MMLDFTFSMVNRVVFCAGCLASIGTECAALGTRVFLVTGREFLRRSGRLGEIEQCLGDAGLSLVVYDGVTPEPTIADAQRGLDEFRSSDANIVLGIGGGSAMDVAKTIASLAGSTGTVEEYFLGRKIECKGAPFVAVATTAGSGSEVTPNSVLTDEIRGVKASIRSPLMFADVAIVDPELTLSLSSQVTAYSGMDALSQAMEAYVSNGANPMSDPLAFDAAVRLTRNLTNVYHDGLNLGLRTQVALGSLMGGIAFASARLGLVHGLAHPLGVRTGLPHGLVCALLLPEVIRFNIPASATKYARLAGSVGVADDASDGQVAERLADLVESMNREMGIEARRSELRVDRSRWPDVIAQALPSGSTKSNPRPVTEDDIGRILATFE